MRMYLLIYLSFAGPLYVQRLVLVLQSSPTRWRSSKNNTQIPVGCAFQSSHISSFQYTSGVHVHGLPVSGVNNLRGD